MVCRTYDSAMQTQGQGHTSGSWDWPLYFVSDPYLLNALKDFHLTSPKVSLHEMACRTHDSAYYADSRLRDLLLNFVPAPYLLNLLNDFHWTYPNVLFQWDGVQNPWLKVKVTLQGHGIYPWILCPLHISQPLDNFHYTLPRCSSQWEGVQNPWLGYVDSRSRSHFKVMGFTLEFHAQSYLLNQGSRVRSRPGPILSWRLIMK